MSNFSKAPAGKAKCSVKTGRIASAASRRPTHTTKVTAKGQITVPKPVREHLKLAKGDRIEFLIGIDGKVTIMVAAADVRKLKGMVAKPDKPVTTAEMNQAIEFEGSSSK
ncbi:MAG: type II toxin-antitoxin system PrlF family antitoxin [Desulfobacterales bacterium]